jgi:fructose-specific phosphotransferase system IIC component
MKKILSCSLLIAGANLFFVKQALAVCPVCTIAIGTGVGFSRWLKIDDTITGLWIGGFIVSLIIWTKGWFDKKNIHFKTRAAIIITAYYLLIIAPLFFTGILGNTKNNVLCFCHFYLDKLLLGIIIGSFAFWLSINLYSYLKEKNNGRSYFPFQKVIMPILSLIILSVIFYYLTI